MAKQPRKQAKGQPTTAHPLFPAVVALWFGALFGLGSLAVRPSLLESIVVQSRIDLILPAAAPPLGITARILVALILAAVGSTIGAVVARWIARPRPELRERKRTALAAVPDDLQLRRRDTHPDAPARRPFSASEELEIAEPSHGGGVLAARRRSLAIEHDEQGFVPYEPAPLPGGAPQVFDIGQASFAPAAEPVPSQPGGDARTAETWPQAAPEPADHSAEAVRAANHEAAQAADAASSGRQVFGLSPAPPPSDESRQIFGQKVADDHVSPDFVRSAGFQTTVFATPEPSPLFAPRGVAAAPTETGPAPAPFAGPPPFSVPPAPPLADFAVPEPATAQAPSLAEAATPPPPLPSPAGLDMTDLAARLAESMARRRAARAAPVALPAAQPALAEPVPSQVGVALPESASPATIAAAPMELPRFTAPPAPVVTAPTPADFALTVPDAVPPALRPLDLEGFEEDDGDLDSLLPPRRIVLPTLRQEPASPPPLSAAQLPQDVAPDETDAAEERYASLLALSGIPANPARSGFVRIDEPETPQAEVEPVVIFPGQMARPIAETADVQPFRRFDAPANAEQGQPSAAAAQSPEVDRDEAERALRMALANLQRMSGAA